MDYSITESKATEQIGEDNSFFEALRDREYPLLDQQNHLYLDYTGGNLCPRSLLDTHFTMLREHILGNPHSTNPTSLKSTELIEETKAAIIEFFNAQDYHCVFTANASGALKILGESYPFDSESTFILLSDNHNSVNGIREFCKNKGGRTQYVKLQVEDLQLDRNNLIELIDGVTAGANNLFAFPAQSNVTGMQHDLSWIEYAQSKGLDVLLDAAAFVPTSRLDLEKYKPDYVCVSFYKMFGYPTGIGCLLVKKTKFNKLRKPWFAGGTVSYVSVVSPIEVLSEGAERYEDGTLNYEMIPAIKLGLDYINEIGIDRINRRVKHLIKYLHDELLKLKHENGLPLVRIFGTEDFSAHGGNIILNFFDAEGKMIPYTLIESRANEQLISLRTGCFCNPGIDEINNCITNNEMNDYFSSRRNASYRDIMDFLGKMRGALRLSVGLGTNLADLDRFVAFAREVKKESRVRVEAGE